MIGWAFALWALRHAFRLRHEDAGPAYPLSPRPNPAPSRARGFWVGIDAAGPGVPGSVFIPTKWPAGSFRATKWVVPAGSFQATAPYVLK